MKNRNARFTIPLSFLLTAFVAVSLIGTAKAPIEEVIL